MKNLRNYSKKLTYGMVAVTMAFVWSCSKDDATPAVSSTDTANVQGESVTDSYYDESNDFSSTAVGGTDATLTGRTNGEVIVTGLEKVDERFKCAIVTVVKDLTGTPNAPVYKGTITIDFKTGCTDAKGNIRKGKIIVTYSGKRFALNSTIVTTFSDYSVNGIKIEGTNALTNLTALVEKPLTRKFTNELTGGKVTFTDGKTATRDHTMTREVTLAYDGSLRVPKNDSWKVLEGSLATGTNRDGLTYAMLVTKSLVYKRSCAESKVFIAVEGTKKFTSGEKVMTIDFGTGACDNTVTVTLTVNGTVVGTPKEVEIKADGSN